jgi:Tol biopolymer transport system component
MRSFFILLITLAICIASCKKHRSPECFAPAIVPYQPYSNPVWHPNGQLLGFNHTPQVGVFANGTPPCVWYMNTVKQDSAGFYLMNKDGTGLRRVTNFYLNTPSWSPDGNWIAFSIPPHIYKMHFNGFSFDTADIIQLTTTGANFFPCWTANSDTIYFDSNNNAPQGTSFYSIWKMANDGSGKIRLTQSVGIGDTRQPFVGTDNKIYYVGYVASQSEVLSMNKDGSNPIQVTFNSGGVKTPKYWQGKVFCENGKINMILSNGTLKQLDSPCDTYDISKNGEIVYSKMDYDITKYNKQIGTLWIMNADGTNKRQLTFNN